MAISGLLSRRTPHRVSLLYGHLADSKAKRIYQLPGVFRREVSAKLSLLQISIIHPGDDSISWDESEIRAFGDKTVPPRCCLPTHTHQQGETPTDIFLTLDLLPAVLSHWFCRDMPFCHSHSLRIKQCWLRSNLGNYTGPT